MAAAGPAGRGLTSQRLVLQIGCCRRRDAVTAVRDTLASSRRSRFAGNMERQQTDNLLKSHASGTYLIRERPAEAERFAISIKYVSPTPVGASEPTSPAGRRWVGWPRDAVP